MKKITYLSFFSLMIVLAGCNVSLADQTANEFTATASAGEFADKVLVEWIPKPYYKSYSVLRSYFENGGYESISSGPVSGLSSFEDKNIESGKEYFYKVEGYNANDFPSFLSEYAVGYGGSSGSFNAPSDIDVKEGVSTKYIEFSWNKVDDAIFYVIKRSEKGLDNWSTIEETPYTSFRDNTVEAGKTYLYKMSSKNDSGYSDLDSAVFEATTYGNVPLEFNAHAGEFDTEILLDWNNVPATDFYEVYRSKDRSSTGSLVTRVTQKNGTQRLSYKDTPAAGIYYYTILYGNAIARKKSLQLRSFYKVSNAPNPPASVKAWQGNDPNNIEISWSTVDGATAYEVYRAKDEPTKNFEIVATVTATVGSENKYLNVNVPNDSSKFHYKITTLTDIPSADSMIVEGWANKPPMGLRASDNIGDRVRLNWEATPRAKSYTISYSETKMGNYIHVGEIPADKTTYDHIIDIGSAKEQALYYKIGAKSDVGASEPSEAVEGKISKIDSPENVKVIDNKTRTKTIPMSWDAVPNAKGYSIYVATLSHSGSNPVNLKSKDFKFLARVDNPSYRISFGQNPPAYPIRRHVFAVKALDGAGVEGAEVRTGIVHRLPVDAADFAKDVDFTIVEAQTQVPNFGAMGSGGKISGRYGGIYDYYAGSSGSKNVWGNYRSFEVILDGGQSVGVDIGNLSATLNGPLHVKGLYSGTVTYHNLNAKQGGYVFAGSMSVNYAGQNVSWSYTKAAAELTSVVLLGSESPPRRPNYEPGGG